MSSGPDASRIEQERAFFDRQYSEDNRTDFGRFYMAALRPYLENATELSKDVRGKTVLEYGCGDNPELGMELAAAGGKVSAFDLSPVAVEKASDVAAQRGLDMDIRVMNGEDLEYDDDEFDIVCGHGVIHHFDLAKAFPEMARVLKPSGVGGFVEPWGQNPVINWYRNRTTDFRTRDEHPLLRSDLDLARRSFGSVEVSHYNLMTLAAVPLTMTERYGAGSKVFGRVVSALERADDFVCTRSRVLGNLGWTVRVVLRRPA